MNVFKYKNIELGIQPRFCFSVTNGEDADDTNFNSSFMSREIATDTVAKIDLKEASSTNIIDLQGTLNSEFSEIDSLRTLSGTSLGDDDLDTFTGSIITDNVTEKVALQELETEVELKENSANKGAVNGYAPLDGSSEVPAANIKTHTGEVTGQTALVLDKTAISNKTTVTPVSGDFVLIGDTSDTDNLKKVDAVSLINIVEFFSANSATKTPGATNNYLLMTGNSVVLTSGSYAIHVLVDYGAGGSPVDYSNSQLVFAGANGADTGVAPANFSTLTGVTLDAGKEAVNSLSLNVTANVTQFDIFSVTRYTLTETQTFFAVPFVAAGTIANARVRTFIYIQRISL